MVVACRHLLSAWGIAPALARDSQTPPSHQLFDAWVLTVGNLNSQQGIAPSGPALQGTCTYLQVPI
jgi:hypothetical protein